MYLRPNNIILMSIDEVNNELNDFQMYNSDRFIIPFEIFDTINKLLDFYYVHVFRAAYIVVNTCDS